MATLTFTFETGAVPLSRIVDAFATTYNYQEVLPDPQPGDPGHTIPNPETKSQFARRMVKEFIRDTVHNIDVRTAERDARQNTAKVELT